ncbi:hypothetical protein [Streptomyces sp. NPDC048663]|uniref:hypothetical protein n=1 Tax=Streptomyces sp. NPDC048663 TaxID=3155638 RepID=UPI00341BBEB4
MHSPEFAFEKDAANVAGQARKLGVTYPVALDNKLTTWNNNRFWPAKYLSPSHGTVRYFKFGEGQYAQTEDLIRTLLKQAGPVGGTAPEDGSAGRATHQGPHSGDLPRQYADQRVRG